VLTEMLTDRGMVAERHRGDDSPSNTEAIAMGTFPDGGKCHVYILSDPKVGINLLRSIMERHDNENFHSLVLVCEHGNTSFTERKLTDEGLRYKVSVFRSDEVRVNVTRHALVPPHSLCSHGEVAHLLRVHSLTSTKQLPYMMVTDPIARYYNFARDDVVRIQRTNDDQEATVYYRLVIG